MNPHANLHMPKQADYVNTCDLECPVCGTNLIRTPRRQVDRVVSLFVPVRRFRCQNFSCQWQGNLRNELVVAALAPTGKGVRRRPRRIPRQFMFHMALVLGGIVLIFVLGSD